MAPAAKTKLPLIKNRGSPAAANLGFLLVFYPDVRARRLPPHEDPFAFRSVLFYPA